MIYFASLIICFFVLNRIIISLALILPTILYAQDLTKVGSKDGLKVSGGVNAGLVLYNVNGIENRRDPFFWQFGGNLNFSLYGISVPFTFFFSQQERNFTQPFNQYGLSPEYKSITLHLGYRSVFFSNYTLGGNLFLGAGIEYKPTDLPLKVATVYGRFARAVQFGGNDGQVVGIPAYERWGYGSKVALGSDKHEFAAMFFRGKDDENSIDINLLTGQIITPAENLVVGFTTRQSFNEKLVFDLEYAYSAFTKDVRNDEMILDRFTYYNNLGTLFTPNASTQFSKAILGNLIYSHQKYNLKFSYRRIDPDYITMGSPFLNNDLEDITSGISFRTLKNKMNVTTTGGFQRNNLDGSQIADMVRLIGSANVVYQVNQQLNLTLTGANYTTSTQQAQFYEVDSLAYFQVTRNLGLGTNYSIAGEKYRHTIFNQLSWQAASDQMDNNSSMYNANLGYNLNVTGSGITMGASYNYNSSVFSGVDGVNAGPTVMGSKTLMKNKLNISASTTYLRMLANGELQNVMQSTRLNASYRVAKRHNVMFSTIYLVRDSSTEKMPSFSEVRANLQYGYNF